MQVVTFKKIKLLIIIAAPLLVMQSCIDYFKKPVEKNTTYSPDLAVPLVYSSMTIKDLIASHNNGLITVDDSNFCTLVYNGTLFSIRADSLINLPDQPLPNYSATLSAAEINTLNTTTNTVTQAFSDTVNYNTGTNNPLLDSIIFNTGTINVTLNSGFPFNGQVVITIPKMKNNGVPFSQTLTFTAASPSISATYNMAGYTIDMTLGGTTSNKFVVDYTVTMTGTGVGNATTAESIGISGGFSNMMFAKIFGDLGQLSLFSSNNDTTAISIFQNVVGNGTGTFTIVNPSITVVVSNSYGVPIRATLPLFEGYNPPATNFPITGVPSPIPILSPTIFQIGQVLTDSFTLSNSNSNIASIVNNDHPKKIIYNGSAKSNPNGPTNQNFLIDTSRCKVYMEANLPLYGTANNFWLIDTVQFSPGSFITSNVVWALFKIYSSNGMPLDLNMQIYFTDSLYNKLDSLISPPQLILKSGVLNGAGKVVSPTVVNYQTKFSQARLQNLKNAKYMLMSERASTSNGGNTNVKIYSNYNVLVKVGMQVQVQTKI
ncbi:MAG: hypothetical protein ACLQQ4_11130 [Bacteroidia bacterium]